MSLNEVWVPLVHRKKNPNKELELALNMSSKCVPPALKTWADFCGMVGGHPTPHNFSFAKGGGHFL